MTQTTLTFEEIDALLKFIEFHTDSFVDEESAVELNEIVGCDVDALYNKLSEMMDEVWWESLSWLLLLHSDFVSVLLLTLLWMSIKNSKQRSSAKSTPTIATQNDSF